MSKIIEACHTRGIGEKNILFLFPYGSRVYQIHKPDSDYDYICIIDDYKTPKTEYVSDVLDITFYTLREFEKQLRIHEVSALECLSLPENDILVQKCELPEFNLHSPTLRKSISAKTSNSFVKCKKKLIVEADFYIGKKSLFHALRIILFGVQLAKHQRIIDFTEANQYYEDIVENPCNDWAYYKQKYKPIHNALMTEFRKLAPKECAFYGRNDLMEEEFSK